MEELYQDQETIIQQLRLLLAAKEEELNKMRGMADSGGGIATGESVTDQLISELEEKKNEVIELRARMEDIETSDREKLSSIADELDEKDKIIASLQSRLSGGLGEETPTDPGENERVIRDSEAARAAEREETERRLAALEEQLEEKERLLGGRGGRFPQTLRMPTACTRASVSSKTISRRRISLTAPFRRSSTDSRKRSRCSRACARAWACFSSASSQ